VPLYFRVNSTTSLVFLSTFIFLQPTAHAIETAGIDQILQHNEISAFVGGLVSGSATRISKELLLHPLDTLRARLQAKSTDKNRLFSDLYSGLVPALLSSIPAGAIFFAVKDSSRKYLRLAGYDSRVSTLVAVALANIPYWVLRCPAENIKTKQQARTVGGDNGDDSLLSLWNTLSFTFKENGIQAVLTSLYSSYASNYIYALPADIIKFLVCKFGHTIAVAVMLCEN